MKTVDELFNNAITHWRDKRCVGSCIIPNLLNDKCIVLGVLQRIYARSPTAQVLILTVTFTERIDLIEFITHQDSEENNQEFKDLINNKSLKLLTIDYIKRNGSWVVPYVCIVYHCEDMCDNLYNLLSRSKFKLVVLNKIMKSSTDMSKLYSICPLLDDFKQNELDELRTNTPVRDTWIDVSIPEDSEDYKLLNYYNEYLITSIRIFGSLDNIEQARIGNTALNISSSQICYQIAYDNGWNEHLDMSIELNVQLDELYNPISLKERASKTYEIIRNRNNLLSDYTGKLDEILKIVEEHKDKKILIINKRSEFASKVTDYLNQMSETIICGNYHDKIEPIPAVDIYGDPIFYKSGNQKGKRKMMCSQAQKTQNEYLFNTDKIRVLSTNSAPDKKLTAKIDVIIITSPQCEDIKSYMYRLINVVFPTDHILLYNIYIKNSLEQNKLQNKNRTNNHEIVNNSEKLNIMENNFDFVVVD